MMLSDVLTIGCFLLMLLSDNSPNCASVADAMTFLIMIHYICTGPFSEVISCIGVLDFVLRKKSSPALIHASGYDLYDASKYMWRIIPLLLSYCTASLYQLAHGVSWWLSLMLVC